MIKTVIFDMFETLITHFHEGAPIYFGSYIAQDAGIAENEFLEDWRATEKERTLGLKSVDEVIEDILKKYHCYSEEKLELIMEKRRAITKSCFQNLHEEIEPMLVELKSRGLQIALISNCFSEEAEVIRKSRLIRYFDAVCLSCELHMRKPDEDIYRSCVDKLGVKMEECLYVGDGGSRELESARSLGMKAVQAAWYLKEGTRQPVGRKPEFSPMDTPLEILNYIRIGEKK